VERADKHGAVLSFVQRKNKPWSLFEGGSRGGSNHEKREKSGEMPWGTGKIALLTEGRDCEKKSLRDYQKREGKRKSRALRANSEAEL